MLEFNVVTNTKQLDIANLQEFEDYLNEELGKRISPVRVVTFLFPWSNVIGIVSLVKLNLKEGTGIVTVEVYNSEYTLEWEAEKLIEKAIPMLNKVMKENTSTYTIPKGKSTFNRDLVPEQYLGTYAIKVEGIWNN